MIYLKEKKIVLVGKLFTTQTEIKQLFRNQQSDIYSKLSNFHNRHELSWASPYNLKKLRPEDKVIDFYTIQGSLPTVILRYHLNHTAYVALGKNPKTLLFNKWDTIINKTCYKNQWNEPLSFINDIQLKNLLFKGAIISDIPSSSDLDI